MVSAAPRGYGQSLENLVLIFGSLYVPITNFDSIIKVEFNDDGSFAGVSRTINDDKISKPVSVEINNGALYVAKHDLILLTRLVWELLLRFLRCK